MIAQSEQTNHPVYGLYGLAPEEIGVIESVK